MNRYLAFRQALSEYTFIDLFAGIGGFHQAFRSFGAKCVFASEWDRHAQRTYYENYGIMPAGDITKIDAAEIPAHDILCAGFPCQAFSVSGKQRGFEDARGTLFFDVARIANYHQPKLLFLENVRNFAKHDRGNTLSTARYVLDQIGYRVWHQVLNASDYGLPQNRERIYIIAIRKDLDVHSFHFPRPTNEVVRLRDIVLPDEATALYRIERDDIRLDPEKIARAEKSKPPLKPIRVGEINKGGQGERIYSEYGHAITLSAYGGGAGSKTGCYLINGRVRKLAPRECARVQGFPDDFRIPVSDAQAWKQFGNSVPVAVLKEIIVSLLRVPGLFQKARVSQ